MLFDLRKTASVGGKTAALTLSPVNSYWKMWYLPRVCTTNACIAACLPGQAENGAGLKCRWLFDGCSEKLCNAGGMVCVHAAMVKTLQGVNTEAWCIVGQLW